jgi:hypothetical protein
MKKLRLELDALRVQSFETARHDAARGTVRANAALASDGALVMVGVQDGVQTVNNVGSCGYPDCASEPVLCPP